jgi:hypothetical protein
MEQTKRRRLHYHEDASSRRGNQTAHCLDFEPQDDFWEDRSFFAAETPDPRPQPEAILDFTSASASFSVSIYSRHITQAHANKS